MLDPQDSIKELLNCVLTSWMGPASLTAQGCMRKSLATLTRFSLYAGAASTMETRESVGMTRVSSKPLRAWVCAVLDPQDSIKELLNCVLDGFDPLLRICFGVLRTVGALVDGPWSAT